MRKLTLMTLAALLVVGNGAAWSQGVSPAASTPAPAWAALPGAPYTERIADATLLRPLRAGGLVLYMRHGNTDNSRPDRVPDVDLNDCRTQRVLNDEGRRVSQAVGRALREARIPVGEVWSSPMCRAKESAQLAFGERVHIELHLKYTANLTTEDKVPVVAATRKLLSSPVPAGTNRAVVAHAPNLADLMGYFPKVEGTVAVFRPTGSGFEYLGSIRPNDWPLLLRR